MLIYFDASLTQKLSNTSLSATECHALENLAIALRKGTHLITGNTQSLIAASKTPEISLYAKQAFTKAAAKASQSRGLTSWVTTYTLLGDFPDLIENHINNETVIIQTSLNSIFQLELQSPCEIIFEDMNDKHIYQTISDWFKKESLRSPHIHTNFRSIHGGGNRTHMVYSERQDQQNTFCLCITDTDKKYPDDVIGPTCAEVINTDNPLRPLSKHLNLDFQEIENLIPLGYLAQHARTNEAREILSSLKRAEDNGHPESKLYFDYKKGLNVKGFYKTTSKSDYWASALSIDMPVCRPHCNNDPCMCFIVKPWPFRSEIRAEIEKKTPISPDDCYVLKKLWIDIGATITSWSVASTPQLA
ncbi:hypothetical protein [Pseudomonas viridiflava]|uniref:hypothetical protein n=1 Tax=Pseudomonas viridiflava TaxID=33069 RepID=UPI0013D44B73|nr:hypothetical protein [Pseudomonas viridiflava]